MKSLKYPALMLCFLSLASCSIFKKSSTSQTDNNMKSNVITDRKWKLVELAGKPVADRVNGKEPFIFLQKSDNRYSASGGCNGLGGTFTLQEHGRIKFSQGMS